MKTLSILLILGFFSLNSASAAPLNILNTKLTEEAYINDIPFNTGEIVSEFLNAKTRFNSLLKLKDEAEINDIPFNTSAIASKVLANRLVKSLKLSDEELVDDIPFNTLAIAEKSIDWFLCSANRLKEENLVDDVPFNTATIAAASKQNSIGTSTQLTEETLIDDVPFDTQAIAQAATAQKNIPDVVETVIKPEFTITTSRSKDINSNRITIHFTIEDSYQIVSMDNKNKNIHLVLSN